MMEDETKKAIPIERTGRGPKIHGNLVNVLLRNAYKQGGEDEVVKVAAKCLSGFTREQLMKIATGGATVNGNNIDGLTIS